MTQSWLVTGGCGFVGSNLADTLLGRGADVTILDNLSRAGAKDNLNWLRARHSSEWRFVQGDTRDAERVATLVGDVRPDAIAHLAGQVAMTTSVANPRLDFEVNALGTFNVLEAVRHHSPGSIVLYSSTNKVYGALNQLRYQETATRYVLPDRPNGLDESLPLDGQSPYGCSKLSAEQYVRDYHRMYGLSTVVFRHSSMYGGRQFATYDQGWIGWFCLKALEISDVAAKPFTISGDGKQVRDVLHASDLVALYVKAAEAIDCTAGQIYNVGGGTANSLSLLELFTVLERIVGVEMRFERLEWRLGDQKVFVADCGKALREFGWNPLAGAEDGLRQMVAWSRELTDRNS